MPSIQEELGSLSKGLVALWDPNNPISPVGTTGLKDVTGNMVDLTLVNNPTFNGSLGLAGRGLLLNGSNQYGVQEEIANGDEMTYLPDAPFMNLLDGEARSQLPASMLGGGALGADLFDADAYLAGIGAWVPAGGNTITTIAAENGVLITRVDASGATLSLRNSADLSSDLTVNVLYSLDIDLKVNGGSVNFRIRNGSSGRIWFPMYAVKETSFTAHTFYFFADTATNGQISITGMVGGETISIRNMVLRAATPNPNVSTDATDVVVIKASDDKVICYGYPRVADVAESRTEKVADGDMEAQVAVFDASDRAISSSYAQSGAQAHAGTKSAIVTRTAVGAGGFEYQYRDNDESTIQNLQLARVHAWIYIPGGQTLAAMAVDYFDGVGSFVLQNVTDTNTWIEIGPYYVLPRTKIQFSFRGVNGDQNDRFHIDDLSIETVDTNGTSSALIWNSPSGDGEQSWLRGDGDPNDPGELSVRKSALNFTGSQTWGILLKPDDGHPGATQYIIAKYDSPINQRAVYVSLRLDGKIQVSVSSGGATATGNEETNSAVFTDGAQNEFTLLIIVITVGDSIKIYKNGGILPSTLTGSVPASLHDSAVPWFIGGTQPSNPTAFFAGIIADLPSWNRPLSGGEVQNYWLSDHIQKKIGGGIA